MGRILYIVFIGLYQVLLYGSSVFNSKAGKIVKGRKNSFSDIRKARKENEEVIWIHCASLGEFEQARPLIEAFDQRLPHFNIYISFFSSSGYEIHQQYPLANCVFYLPADTPSNAKKLLHILDPSLVIFIKYEFWYNFIRMCHTRHIPIFSVSTILRPDHFVFSRWGGIYRNMLRMFSRFYVQNQETKDLLQKIGIENSEITGDTRIDRVYQICHNHLEIPKVRDFRKEDRLIILGSTWKPDIDLWTDFINRSESRIKFAIAPHHVNEGEIRYIEKSMTGETIRFSEYPKGKAGNARVLIIDNIGMLSSIYSYAYLSYVGGSFSEGLHNILEPATYGIPVLIGKDKSNRKYQEAMNLIAEGGVFEIQHSSELPSLIEELLTDESVYRQMCDITRKYVQRNIGATQKIFESITNQLS